MQTSTCTKVYVCTVAGKQALRQTWPCWTVFEQLRSPVKTMCSAVPKTMKLIHSILLVLFKHEFRRVDPGFWTLDRGNQGFWVESVVGFVSHPAVVIIVVIALDRNPIVLVYLAASTLTNAPSTNYIQTGEQTTICFSPKRRKPVLCQTPITARLIPPPPPSVGGRFLKIHLCLCWYFQTYSNTYPLKVHL